jgi:hypothetical protein
VEATFERYFSNLFKKGPDGNIDSCLQPITCQVSEDMNLSLERAITVEEIEVALFQMAPLKAPGPDGLNACFFQHNWPTIRNEVCNVILDIFHSGIMPSDLNLTHVALIPKVKKPTSVAEFRPISLCNVLYKLISKVLANCLKILLPQIIAPTQSAFIP